MATWEDGPEYAPLDPPDQFTVPDVQPLEEPPSAARQPAAPADRPQFGDPSASVTPLNALVPSAAEQQRDPHAPYRVESATVTGTSGGAWGAAHWHAFGAGSAPAAGTATVPPPQPATGSGAQTQALTESPGPAQSVGNYPAPGTPAWFGSPPAARSGTAPVEQPPPPSVGRAAPIGAVIALACAIFYVLAPFAFLAGFLLSLPAKYARRQLMFAWAGVGGSILMISTLSTLSNYGDLSDWYDVVQTWSLLGSLLMIILIFVIVYHEIQIHRR